MNWIDLTFIVLGSYVVYYAVNILIDVSKSKRVKTAGDNTLIQLEDLEETQDVTKEFTDTSNYAPPIEEEEQTVTVNYQEEEEESQEEQSLEETKKKQSEQEENLHEKKSETKDEEDVKFQSMPVSEFLAKAKMFSNQVDFS